ncbi:DUF4239 domain-containing protein [Nocardia sp. XZ_19_385]|uniref:bestrophin-like domain n=1 Tax=Nocardia sp. XZ_19_385 TaxID=2769488 RepID=UPI00188F5D8F|nr:DUF4239 domain-containing protein [Nocardia sp. XZ_19_385]
MDQEIFIVIAVALATVTLFVLGDRLRPKSWRQTSDESSGTLVLDLIKTLFTAAVAFTFVVCWQQQQTAHNHTVAEAKALVDVYEAAQALPEVEQRRVRDLVQDYTNQVISQEWPLMENEHQLSTAVGAQLETIRETVVPVRSTDSLVTDARSRTLTALDRVTQARADRAIDAGRMLPTFLFAILGIGSLLVLLNPVLSGMRVTWRSVVMTALLGVVVGGALLAVHELQRPFSSVIGVPTDAFAYAQSQFQLIDDGSRDE